ncbi:MAG: hypothetical protein WCX93_11940 [Burkholderiaceae bacterium]
MTTDHPTDNKVPVLQAPTITTLPADAAGAVIVSGSHGGLYPGYCAAKGQVRAVVLHDAGVGKDEAGIASLAYLQSLGVAAATVASTSCRIGDSDDMLARGRVSHANLLALNAGVVVGMECRQAAEYLTQAPWQPTTPEPLEEARTEETVEGGRRRIILLDSASLVGPEDSGQIIVTASHGALVGGKPAMALRTDGYAAVFSDAGGGMEDAGYTRLPALDERGIAAFTVSAASARIGDARSIYMDGIISAANRKAASMGCRVGEAARPLLRKWACL